MREINYIFEDFWSQSRVDVMEAFEYIDMDYYNNTADQNSKGQVDQRMTYDTYDMIEIEMMIETRPRFPSNKLTFTVANIAKGKTINFFTFSFSNPKYDVDVVLEDSKRKFVNSLHIFCLLNIEYHFKSSNNNLSVSLRECSTIT